MLSLAATIGVGLFAHGAVSAERYTSPSFTIDASVGNSFGGSGSSTNYKLVASGGESIIGGGTGGSYILGSGYVAQLDKSLQVTVQPAGAVSYHPLDESTAQTAFDASANSLLGTASGGPTTTTGKVRGAWNFDGSDDKISFGSPAAFNSLTDVTWSVWVYPTDVTKDQMIISRQVANFLRIYNNRPYVSFYDNSTQKTLQSPSTISNNQWYHIAATYTAGSMKLYVNGTEVASRSDITGPLTFNTGVYEIGQYKDSDRRSFVGKIDEAKLFSRVLTSNEIEAEYDAGVAGNAAGLAFSGDILPGASQASGAEAVVQTDAPGYNLMINQDQDLTSGGNSIPAVTNSGTIGSPVSWSESTTKGLGFTLTSASATALPGKWGTNPNYAYAAVPGSSTSFYTRTGYTAGGKDTLSLQYRVDIPAAQPPGKYSNTITYTGVMTP